MRYYYLPDVEAYYDIQSSTFIYYSGGAWIHRSHLPSQYRNYDLYSGYKVVMVDYHGNAPHTHFKEYKVKYKKGYRGPSQKTIGTKVNGNSSHKKQNASPKKQQNKESHIKSSQNSNKGNSNGNKGGGKGSSGKRK